jgi:flagellar biosynthetic protein FlhB
MENLSRCSACCCYPEPLSITYEIGTVFESKQTTEEQVSIMSDKNSDQEKTEEPTQRKLEKAREEGNVSISKEVSSVILMIVSIMVFVGSGGFMYGKVEELFETFLINSGMALNNQDHAIVYLEQAMILGFEMMAPALIVLMLTAVIVNVAQTGAAFSTKAIAPKGSKMNPINGIK